MDTLSEAEIEPSVDQEEKSPKGTLKKRSNHIFAYLLHFFEILRLLIG